MFGSVDLPVCTGGVEAKIVLDLIKSHWDRQALFLFSTKGLLLQFVEIDFTIDCVK